MSDILTQAEIDELLNALSAGLEPETPPETSNETSIKPYDFKTANRFPKEQIRTMSIAFQSYSQLMSNRLTAILRTSVECELLALRRCPSTNIIILCLPGNPSDISSSAYVRLADTEFLRNALI